MDSVTTNKIVGSYIGGEVRVGLGRKEHQVHFPFDGSLVGTIAFANETDLEDALQYAYQCFNEEMKVMPSYKRAEILRNTASLLKERIEEFAKCLTLEVGKPITEARAEVIRAIQVLEFSADEAKKIQGELVNMDAAIGGENRLGLVQKLPIGVVLAITPFNFPLNLALHKIGPAIAAGNTVILKPAEKTPLSSVLLYEAFIDAGLPKNAIQLVMGEGAEVVPVLVQDSRVAKVTFTGSLAVGKIIKAQAGLKKVTLELGSNAPNILLEDADLNKAIPDLVKGAFSNAGQVCISVQRIYVHSNIVDAFKKEFIKAVQALKVGNPLEDSTQLSTQITADSKTKSLEWIHEAVAHGAIVETGGKFENDLLLPTVLSNVTDDMKVVCQEVFAPIVSIMTFDHDEEAIALANKSEYGLQAGVYTTSLDKAFKFAREIESGGVWINEISTYRQDNYPYGGVKNSGIGKEGVAYAIEDMLQTKFIGIKL